jgi:Recombinase/Recombinase zinc beta ribbon domain
VKEPEFTAYKRIFTAYLKGESCIVIAKRLNQERIPLPGAAWNRISPRWKHASVWRHTNIHALLTRRSAVGELTSCGQKIACPPVVDLDVFEKVQGLLRLRNMRAGRPPTPDARALLRGLAYCPHCGSRMWIVRGGSRGHWHLYYACAMARLVPLDSKCRKRHRVDAVDERAKALVREYVLDPRLCKIVRNDNGGSPEEEIPATRRELKKLDRAEEHLVRLRVKGLASPRVLENQLLEIKRERAAIEARITKAKLARERRAQHDAAHEDREDTLTAVRGLLRGNAQQLGFERWRDIVRNVAGFLEPIRLMPDGTPTVR